MTSVFSSNRLLIFLIPLYVVTMTSVFLAKQYPFYISQPDPAYVYLFNGMNLAGGNMEVGHIDHPGTTAQCFAAVIIFIKHLFVSSGIPLYQDVLTNPESYLFTCSVVLIVLLIGVNYLIGAYIFRHTGNSGLSILFQLTPLLNINIIQRGIELEPEAMIIIAAPFLMAYLFIKTNENNIHSNEQPNNKTVILFAILSGFLIVSKYTCVPVILLVLFILGKNRQRLLYAGMVVGSFFFFIIPALPKFKEIFLWVWNLATHEGVYGRGEERVVNPSQFVQNIKGIFITDTVFTSIYCLITLAFLVTMVNWMRRKKDNPFVRTISGVWLSITALVLLVAKHCDFHYLIFAECCFPLGMLISYKIFSPWLLMNPVYLKHSKAVLSTVFIVFILFLVIEKIRYLTVSYSQPVGINEKMHEYSNLPIIISTKDGLACQRIEPALYIGYMYSGNMQNKYTPILREKYPNAYIYWYGTKTLTHWNEIIPIPEFFVKNKKALVYLKGYNDTAQINILHRFCPVNANPKCNEQEIYKNEGALQSVYLIGTGN